MSSLSALTELHHYILADGLPIAFDARRSHGPYFVDAKTGESYLDLFSFFATQPIGFNHPKLNTAEFREKLGSLAIHRPSLSDVYTEDYARAIASFAKLAGDSSFQHFFFVEGGALGNENAMKAAFDWKVRKNLAAGRGEKGSQIIHLKHAFHGRTGYTLSLTNTADPKKHMYFPKFSWPRISSPALRFPVTEEIRLETQQLEAQSLSEIRQALEVSPHDIAALIIEPIQAEGGDRHFRPEYLQALRHLADENEFLLIFDEVQTGLGLTGSMWAFQQLGVTPDLVSFGKKAQVGGCISGKRIDEVADNVFRLSSRINSTWGSNLIDLLRMERYLEIIVEDKLIDNVQKVGTYWLEALQAWAKEDALISNVRGRGLMIAFDCPSAQFRDRLRERMFAHHVIVLGCGEKSIRLRPHLDITRDVVDVAMKAFKEAAHEVSRNE